MKLRLALLGTCALIGFAAPAHAATGSDIPPGADDGATVANAGFLDSLRAAGITYADPGRVIEAGRAVCGLVDKGEPGLEVVSDIKANNPGFSTDGAAQFAAMSAHAFCPQQLIKK